MLNLLGDLWQPQEPDWLAVLAEPRARLHLYGKKQARPGRKMGHIVAMGPSLAVAQASIARLEALLGLS